MIKIYATDDIKELVKKLPLNIKLVNKDADLYIVNEKEFEKKEGKFFIVILDNKEKIKDYLMYENLDVLVKPFSFDEFFLRVKTFYFFIKRIKELKKRYLLLLKETKNKAILDVINILAHKIRQHLHAINLITTNLAFKNFDVLKDELQENFEIISKLNNEISSIFDDFFKFFKKDLDLKEYYISSILKDIKHLPIKIKKDFKILCDKNKLLEIFLFFINEIDVKSIEIDKNLIKLKTDKDVKFLLESGDNIKIYIFKKIIENCLHAKIYQKDSTIFIEIEGGVILGEFK